MSTQSALAPDAAMALGIASTAMPFAGTPGAEVERWLRILRLHGEAGIALQALGVGEQRLREPGHDTEPGDGADTEEAAPDRAGERDPVARVSDEALRIAGRRGAAAVATTDLLLAVMRVYGRSFDRVLAAYGADRAELTERLDRQAS